MKNHSSLTIFIAILSALTFSSCQIEREVEFDIAFEDAFVHSAYFWFKEDATEEQISAFKEDSEKLKEIKTVKGFYTGKPANTNRPVIENTYDYALIFLFEDLEAQEYYQKDPLHVALIEKHAPIWERVMVTDVE